MEHLLEPLTIFRHIDCIWRGANNLNPGRFQIARKLQRGLPPKLNNNALRLLNLDDCQDIFEGQRLEIEPIGSVKISANRLWITIDHNGFVTVFSHGECRVNTTIIELDALADSIWTTTQNHDLFTI